MVPTVAFPPETELTDQVTVLFEEPETATENLVDAPARMLAVWGETVTETEDEEGGFWGAGLCRVEVLLQATRNSDKASVVKNFGGSIVRVVCKEQGAGTTGR